MVKTCLAFDIRRETVMMQLKKWHRKTLNENLFRPFATYCNFSRVEIYIMLLHNDDVFYVAIYMKKLTSSFLFFVLLEIIGKDVIKSLSNKVAKDMRIIGYAIMF